MYKLPDDITELFLKKDIVKMICFNINQIYIHFESSIVIGIEHQYTLSQNGVDKTFEVYPIVKDNGLLMLLEKEVRFTNVSNSRQDLGIHFEDNIVIKLSSSVNYESYTITINDKRIII